MRLSTIIASTAVAGGIAAGMGLAAATASAQPAPSPAWANGNPQVWDQGWQRWGVWLNGVFVPTF
ncbi:hypothetical protein [Mycolicibacterium litorale]|uniref:hypothetical protein n=1 Tax=Mycolicibacterium litorale TaxID=758802 RepID=UPI0039A3312D